MSYHYTDSGLDDVVLENGYHDHDTPYGKGVSIEDSAGLHDAIGRHLIERSTPLNGAELRFLRLQMERTQSDLAATIGATEQTFRLWEKHRDKPIPGPPDRLIRALFSEFLGDDRGLSELLKRYTVSDPRDEVETGFRRIKGAWTPHRRLSTTGRVKESAAV